MNNYYNRYWATYNDTTKDFDYKWPAIFPIIPRKQSISILDIGCGTGKVLAEIKKLNPQAQIFGVDVSSRAINVARKLLPQCKFTLIKDGEKLPFKNNSMDYIFSFDVIEHIYDIQNILYEYKRILKPGGNILISTPYHGLIKNLVIALIGFEKVFNPYEGHIRFFTKKSLSLGFRMINFEIIKIGYFGRFYPLWRGMYLLAHKNK